MQTQRDLIITCQGRMIFISEYELKNYEELNYYPQILDMLEEGLPDPFLINFWWDGSARQISEQEQRRIIALIKDGFLD